MHDLDVLVTARRERFLHEAAAERQRPLRHRHHAALARRIGTALHLVHAAPECSCQATAAV